ncbi:hypothetical protein [Epilithonimonas zeae]|uniref:hypothetical protein n=1 Tax=Epilithonimonas zeae TaxID=1416779 RepID=UPI00200C4782|nr:hypothetical protein [Epilithonimonas zeae]UQB67438.1 hypothetical protein KI430_10330 [Epilithonimonas zeae]
MKKISIPNPCSENWNEMSPEDQGRFCSVCSKCVIDFTEKKPQEIQQLIEKKSDDSICGRFYNHQLNINDSKSVKIKEKLFRYVPLSFQNSRLSLGLLSLILFLTGCSKPEKENCIATTGLVDIIEEDTIPKNEDFIMGEYIAVDDSVVTIHKKKDSINFNKNKKLKK